MSDWAIRVPPRPARWYHRAGISSRSERTFNVLSSVFVLVVAIGWSWSIATARPTRGSGDSTAVAPSASVIAAAITERNAPSTAYLTDAVLNAFVPLRGESGRLRAQFSAEGAPILRDTLPSGAIVTVAGEEAPAARAPRRPGVWSVAIKVGNAIKPMTDFRVITLKPASEARAGRIGLYFIGSWPSARGGAAAKGNYAPPRGFIEVTSANQNTYVSEHFRLRDFLPKDQFNVWPKYLVLETKLLDKLELVLEELRRQGVNTRGVRVMSGFRTPQYNSGVGDTRGRASLSRHMYGDAADIYIDNDGNGAMDDLNRDGRVDISDAQFIRSAGERVERAHPSLIGGIGVYRANAAHGPFTHIDTRGYRARW
ncbi:MAG: D-Ala-D-Ala carboxypeptidase family metallohydrolase [Gemmatimonadaceae bacterium]